MFTSGYGFIVDYLAEVLRELRKEDHTQTYRKFFELSDSITTRDKDSVAKTFSGLVKVIFPDGELTEDEAQVLLDAAIEARKRVKQQLVKMDETFEEVDFSYKVLSSGIRKEVETLEVEETYGIRKSAPETEVPASEKKSAGIQLEPVQKRIRDNQSGISYDNLLGAFLAGATNIRLTDPYIRFPYQIRNLMEFARLVAQKKDVDTEVKLHLVTFNEEPHLEDTKKAFSEIADSLEPLGIFFTWEFNPLIHDRSIDMNNGWKILLGRGLDIFQKTNGRYDIAEYYQEKRQCKSCEITLLSIPKFLM